MLIVELGLKLDKDFEYYNNLLKNNGLINDFNVTTHDIYYTNKDLDGLSEYQMKNACIRLRSCNNSTYKIQNNLIENINIKEVDDSQLFDFEKELFKHGFNKVFDTKKIDHHYWRKGMSSKVQLQEIDDIGLLVYYDNKEYYNFDLDTQRENLISELNSYGFSFKYDVEGLDKLRTLYYGKEMFSKNQND